MRFNQILAVLSVLLLSSGAGFSKEASTALEMARQLNRAFIEVADQVSPAVVVIRVAHKPDFSDSSFDADGENPFWDLIPREFRKQLEQQQKQKQRRESRARPPEPVFDGQGSGVVIREEGYILTNR